MKYETNPLLQMSDEIEEIKKDFAYERERLNEINYLHTKNMQSMTEAIKSLNKFCARLDYRIGLIEDSIKSVINSIKSVEGQNETQFMREEQEKTIKIVKFPEDKIFQLSGKPNEKDSI